MPREKPKRKVEPGLVGLWFRCANGHLVEEPVYLGDHIYCPNLDCDMTTAVVHSTADDKAPSVWNKSFGVNDAST